MRKGLAFPARRTVVVLTIGSFSIAALMGVAALLRPGRFGSTEGKVLLTTLVVGCASVLVLCYLAVAESSYRLVGRAGGVAVVVAVVSVLVLLWGYSDRDPGAELVRTFGVSTVLAVTLAQFSLLLALVRRGRALARLLWVTIALGTLLAALVCMLILGVDAGDATGRFIGVVAILDVLGTVVSIAVGVFGNEDASLKVTVSPALATRLRHEAEQTGRPVGDLVDEGLSRYLDATRAERSDA
jgi:hypothetical protein